MTDKTPEILYAIVAVVGGLARSMGDYLHGKTPLAWHKILAQMVVSGFSGVMFADVMGKINPDWMFVASGIGGYMGVQAIEFLFDIIRNALTKK